MAGCKPEYMPVVAAAVKPSPRPRSVFIALRVVGPTIVVVVNGPIAPRLGINATNNVFGGGNAPTRR
jgi:hypothetical protein